MESNIKNRSSRSYQYEAIKATGVVVGIKDIISAEYWRDLLTKQVNDIAFYDVLRDFEKVERNKIILGNISFTVNRNDSLELGTNTPADVQHLTMCTLDIKFEIIVNDYAFTYHYEKRITELPVTNSLERMAVLLQSYLIIGVCYKHNLQLIQQTLISEAF